MTGETKVKTDRGQMTMEMLYASAEEVKRALGTSQVTRALPRVVTLVDGAFRPVAIRSITRSAEPQWVVCVSTSTGVVLNLTPDHRILRRNMGEWAPAKDLKRGDELCAPMSSETVMGVARGDPMRSPPAIQLPKFHECAVLSAYSREDRHVVYRLDLADETVRSFIASGIMVEAALPGG